MQMNKEQKITTVRIAVSLAMLIGGFALHLPLAKLIYFIAAGLIAGADVIWKALKNLIHGDLFDEHFLMSLAAVGAFCIGEYPEAVAIMIFYQIGELFQDIAVDRSKSSISSLMDIRPEYANLESIPETAIDTTPEAETQASAAAKTHAAAGTETQASAAAKTHASIGAETHAAASAPLRRVAPDTVPEGSVIVIKPGERIPLDGTVLSGTSSLDTVALTGESRPRDVAPGDAVLSGSVNLTGILRVKTSGVYAESAVARILDLVENAEHGKANSERFITRFSKIYTPIVVLLAILLATVVPIIAHQPFTLWLNRALIFLVVSCPCALIVSVPLSFFAGIGSASKHKILVKGSQYLETLAEIKTVVFDKTGTLTEGSFTVTEINPEKGVTEDELLETAALAEIYSDHPVAVSLREAWNKNLDRARVTDTENFAGEGLRSTVDGRFVYAGNERLMSSLGIKPARIKAKGTIVYIAVDRQYLGHIVISDTVRPTAKEAVTKLKSLGIAKVAMLTGDRADVARDIGIKLGITELHAELLPEDKVTWLKDIREGWSEIEKLAFVGDGINDAPVLKYADVGVAMGGAGSQAAIEAADIVLMEDNPERIVEGIVIARKTLRIARQNIVFSIAVKILIMILALAGVADLWVAVFADVGVTVLAVANALRAMRINGAVFKPVKPKSHRSK